MKSYIKSFSLPQGHPLIRFIEENEAGVSELVAAGLTLLMEKQQVEAERLDRLEQKVDYLIVLNEERGTNNDS
jgi:hypothetical protein